MVLIIVLLFCAFFLPFPSDVNLYFFHHFFEKKTIRFQKNYREQNLDKSIVPKKG